MFLNQQIRIKVRTAQVYMTWLSDQIMFTLCNEAETEKHKT